MSWAKPKYNNESFKTVKTLKDGKTVFRILPPLHSLAVKGQWFHRHSQHFGYTIRSKSDPSKEVPRTFYCVEQFDYTTKTVVRECPECRKIKEVQEDLKSARDQYAKQGKSEKQIAERVEQLVEWVKRHNLDRKDYINVMFADGTMGTLKVGFKVKKQIDALRLSLLTPEDPKTKPIDAIDADQGVWFEVVRTGKGLQTDYVVSIATETLNVDVGGETIQVRKVKLAPLTEDDHQRAQQECFDLADVGIRRLPFDRVAALVNSPGDPESVEAIFSVGERVEQSPSSREVSPTPAVTMPPPPAPRAAVTVPAAVQPKTPAAPVSNDDVEAMSEEQFRKLFGK